MKIVNMKTPKVFKNMRVSVSAQVLTDACGEVSNRFFATGDCFKILGSALTRYQLKVK